MSDLNRHGKRERSRKESSLGRYWKQYKDWVAGLNRGQRIRYRCLQVATILAIVVIVVWAVLSAWIRVPDLPDFTQDADGDGVSDLTFDGAEVPDIARSGRKEGIYTFLVAGRDVASGSTDTILLLSYDTNNKTIKGLNVPRDTMINTSATSKRINSVYTRNRGSSDLPESERVAQGMKALGQEVAKVTGITPDFYVLVEWEAIGDLVNALGGVYFDVPFDMDYDDPYQDLHIHQEAGYRKLDGDDAMQVIRWRKNNDGSNSGGDVARLEIQQEFLKAVATECLKPTTFLKIPDLARIFTEKVYTDLSVGNILAFAQMAYGMDPESGVSFETAPIADSFKYNGAALITLDPEGILEIVNDGMNPYQRDIEARDLQLVYRNSNGSFGVTNAELADPKMGGGSSSSSSSSASSSSSSSSSDKEEVPETPDTSDTTQTGDGSQSGGSSSEGGQTGGDSSQTGGGDTSQGGSQTGGGDTSQGGGQTGGDSSQTGGDGSQTGGGDTSQGGGQTGGDSSQAGGGQSGSEGQGGSQSGSSSSGSVQPDPNPSVSQGSETSNSDHTVAVLPAQPEPVQPAA